MNERAFWPGRALLRAAQGCGLGALLLWLCHCGPTLPPGTRTCAADADCKGGEVCAIKVCRQACSVGQTGGCPSDEVCQPLPSGKAACAPGQGTTPPPTTGTGEVGEACAKKNCKPGLICGQASHETDFFCRTACDPQSPKCPQDHFCGKIDGSNQAACFPNSKGAVAEFGKCGGSFGDCKKDDLKLICVVDPGRTPQHGFCLRSCNSDGSCRKGYHCIQSLKACAEDCDTAKDQCSYGSCRRLSSMPENPVCY